MTHHKQQLLKQLQQKQSESHQQTGKLFMKSKLQHQNQKLQQKEKLKTYQHRAPNSVSCLLAVSYPTIIICFYFILLINICSNANAAVHKIREIDAVEKQRAINQEDDLRVPHSVNGLLPALQEFSRHTVIHPEIQHGLHRRVIRNTLQPEDGLHAEKITLSYYHDGRRVLIDLQRNDELLPKEHFLRYQNSNTQKGHVVKQNFTKTELALCHYKGTIRGKPSSNVAVSTCDGYINGVVFSGTETYFIHSGSDGQLHDDHYLLRQSDMLHKNLTCGYKENESFLDLHDHQKELDTAFLSHNKIDGNEFQRILRHKRSYEDNNMIRGPYNANNHSSYVELIIVVDNKVYKSYGENTKKVHQHCKDLANIINALYVPLNIFVALVGVVIWNESNEIEFSSNGDVTLRNFLNYRRNKLVIDHPNDNAQLLTKETFSGGVVGKALKGPICTHVYSGGVSMEHSTTVAVVATTMAHEMGHNFGMEHDTPDCKCQDEKCIMAASSTSVVPEHWSSCSIDQLNIAFSRGMNYCLRNKPTKLFESPQCGNGFVEPGEQCDCGLPKYCENSCCDAHTCMLHANASCATGECCDLSTCRPKSAGMQCRGADNECDLPEYCTGESEYCPTDVFKRDTESCDSNRAYCYQGSCRSHNNQCRILWGPTGESSESCYVKNTEGKRGGNCGMNRINSTYIPCEPENIACGLLHCYHLNERLEFGMESAAELSNSFINKGGSFVACRTALVDLGLQSIDPGLAPNGAKCAPNKMCLNQKCVSVALLRAEGMGKACANNCSGNGVCNSRGHCHCDIGFSGVDCRLPGHGGSPDSGPSTNPNSHAAFQKFMYIFFFAVVPFMVGLCFFMYYCRNHPYFVGGKFTENMYVSTPKTLCSFSTSSPTASPLSVSASASVSATENCSPCAHSYSSTTSLPPSPPNVASTCLPSINTSITTNIKQKQIDNLCSEQITTNTTTTNNTNNINSSTITRATTTNNIISLSTRNPSTNHKPNSAYDVSLKNQDDDKEKQQQQQQEKLMKKTEALSPLDNSALKVILPPKIPQPPVRNVQRKLQSANKNHKLKDNYENNNNKSESKNYRENKSSHLITVKNTSKSFVDENHLTHVDDDKAIKPKDNLLSRDENAEKQSVLDKMKLYNNDVEMKVTNEKPTSLKRTSSEKTTPRLINKIINENNTHRNNNPVKSTHKPKLEVTEIRLDSTTNPIVLEGISNNFSNEKRCVYLLDIATAKK